MRIALRNTQCYIWLDSDAAGVKGAKRAVGQLQMQGAKCIYDIKSVADPKYYSREEIATFIKDAKLCST